MFSSLAELPTEILDAIFSTDPLRDDISSLKACSLAGRALTPSSQRVLLSKIRLTPPRFSEHLEQKPSKCAALLSLIHESPHIAFYITQLTIVDGHKAAFKSNEKDYDLNWVADDNIILASLLDALVYLRSFTIHAPRLSWIRLPMSTRQALQTALSRINVEHIEIELGKWPCPLLVQSTTNLKSLILRGQCDTEDPVAMANNHRRPILNSLVVDDMALDFSYNIDWLIDAASPVDVSHVRKLAVRIHSAMRKNKPTMKLIHHCSKHLDTLSITPSADVNEIAPVVVRSISTDPMILNGLNDLRFLSLHLNFGVSTITHAGWGSPFAFLLHFFSPLTSPHHLEQITLYLDCTLYQWQAPDQNRWDELDRALDSEFLAALRIIRFHVVELPMYSRSLSVLNMLREKIENSMPFLLSCQVLRFTYEESLIPKKTENDNNWFAHHP